LVVRTTKEIVLAYGHCNIQANHPSTLMITTDRHLSKTGDCVIAVGADKALSDFSCEFKEQLRKPNAKLTMILEAGPLAQKVNAIGHPKLTLISSSDMVIRKSDYTSDRTLAIHADKSSRDLPREFVQSLRNPEQQIKITLRVN